MLEKYCYQTDIVFQQIECPVSESLLCGIDVGYSGIKIQSPNNASTIPSIVVKEKNDTPLLVGAEDIRYRDKKVMYGMWVLLLRKRFFTAAQR